MAETLTYENISKKQRTIIMVGLAIGLLAACFDGTVTTTCGPKIAEQFNGFDLLPWLTTGYLLFETVAIPLSGKLSDLYGRKKLLLVGLGIFGLASLVAGLANSMILVVVARALQGAGGGILIPVATAAVSDLYPPEERGKIQGALGALFGIGMGAGPLIGGALAAISIEGFAGWHFAFLINIPIVILVFLLCKGEFPSMVEAGEKPVIDFKGIALISGALIILVFFFQYLGKAFDVLSWQTLVIVGVVILLLKTFSWNETRAKEPIIAPHVFVNPTVRSAAIMLFLLGFALVADELFMGMYLQTVIGFTPVEAGMYILLMVIGMMITSAVGGALLEKTGIKPWVIAGPLLLTLGFFLFTMITPEFNAPLFMVSEFVFGAGAGCLLASLMTAVQNSCEHKEVGMTTSAVNLMRNIGSTIGTSILTLVVNIAIYNEATTAGGEVAKWADEGLDILNHLKELISESVRESIKAVFTDSVATAYFFCAIVLLIAVVIGLRFKIVRVSQTKEIINYTEEKTKDNKKY